MHEPLPVPEILLKPKVEQFLTLVCANLCPSCRVLVVNEFAFHVGRLSTIGIVGFLNSETSKNVFASRFTQKPMQSSLICPILRNPLDIKERVSISFSWTLRFKYFMVYYLSLPTAPNASAANSFRVIKSKTVSWQHSSASCTCQPVETYFKKSAIASCTVFMIND